MKVFRPADGRWERGIMDVRLVPRIAGALLFLPIPHRDERGFFCRTFDADVVGAAGLDPAAFVQHSLSRSALGVVRGLHVRRGDGEAKLVRCSFGAIFDVIVDLRPASPTYRNWESFELRDDEQVTLYVPAAARMGFRPSPTLRTFPIRSTAHTTRPRTSQSHSMIRIWPSRGHFPSPSRPSGTGRRRHSRLRPGSWCKPAPKLVI